MEMMKFTRITRNEANRADLIRFYLLERYGGIWIDGSVFHERALTWRLVARWVFCFNARRFSKGDVVTLRISSSNLLGRTRSYASGGADGTRLRGTPITNKITRGFAQL